MSTPTPIADPARIPGPEPIAAVLFDFHLTLVDGGDVAGWVRAGWAAWAGNGRWASDPTPGSESDPVAGLGAERAADVANFLDHIWDHARLIDPHSARDESPQQHRAVFLATMAGCPAVEASFAEALYDVMPQRWSAYADTVPVLTALRERGVRTAIVSNVGFDLRPIIERNVIAVDALVMSYEVGSVKPDPGIFNHALELLGATPQESLMVGDSWRDDSGAAALGIRTLLLPRTTGPVHGLGAVLRLVG